MFAIYSAAVMTLKEHECWQKFRKTRKSLLSRYISATEAALSRARFMGTTNLVILQALFLHLLSVRDIHEPRALWSMTGVAVRIAQGMGLERDGLFLGLPPFEIEMRRRIWWMLKGHGFRTAELCGLAKLQDLDTGGESTKWPTNVNDDQLYPGMPSLPAESNMLTDMAYVAMRYELTKFAAGRIGNFRQQGKDPSQWNLHDSDIDKGNMDGPLKELEEVLETKYVRYCDPSQPLHVLIMLLARTTVNVVRFLTHHPRRWASVEDTPVSERQLVWETGIKLLEQHEMVQCHPQLKQFEWNAAYYLQWHAFIHVVDTLRTDPLIKDAEKAWQLIDNTYKNNPDMVSDTKEPTYVALGNLCLEAYSAREAASRKANLCLEAYSAREAASRKANLSPPTFISRNPKLWKPGICPPTFILQLRQQREIAKAKAQARDAKSSQLYDSGSHGQANTRGAGPRPDASVIFSGDTVESTYLQQNTTSYLPSVTQTGGATQDDPYWFINGSDDSQVGNVYDVVIMDLDFTLAQVQKMEDDATPAITWEQWDAWLADSHVMRLQSSGFGPRASA